MGIWVVAFPLPHTKSGPTEKRQWQPSHKNVHMHMLFDVCTGFRVNGEGVEHFVVRGTI